MKEGNIMKASYDEWHRRATNTSLTLHQYQLGNDALNLSHHRSLPHHKPLPHHERRTMDTAPIRLTWQRRTAPAVPSPALHLDITRTTPRMHGVAAPPNNGSNDTRLATAIRTQQYRCIYAHASPYYLRTTAGGTQKLICEADRRPRAVESREE
ncbi:hypothetical protein BDQ12DRAFT_206495 [Crucibulum laeve]|uniref:Uncharacterized protein n=1 Tax=Crucibulum laeve TaxID=68775 RepID=A0A5C3LWU0_9AGAR|nr:hypothetical protein BDQ12DRAFT_206495 [Crucibulum laeve]